MRQLEHKVPPPIVLIFCIAISYLLAKVDSARGLLLSPSWPNTAAGIGLALMGIFIAYSGVMQFKKAQTTVNPLNPSKASSMVITGVFSVTRNPMYLGMACIIIGAVTYLGSALSVLGLIIFLGFITRFQIIPEERALSELFGDEFTDYKNKVRRWL